MAQVQELKLERTNLKKKVKSAIKRLQFPVEQSRPTEHVNKLSLELDVTYSDFLSSNEDCADVVTSNPE